MIKEIIMGTHKRLADKKKLAYQMYVAGHSLSSIASHTGVNIDTLKNWAYRGSTTQQPWRERRKEEYSNRLLEVLEDDVASLDEIFTFGLNTIKRSLASMEIDRVILTQDGIAKLVGVLDKVQTWTRAQSELDALLELEVESDKLAEELENHPFFAAGDKEDKKSPKE
jgi:hypothetical protein